VTRWAWLFAVLVALAVFGGQRRALIESNGGHPEPSGMCDGCVELDVDLHAHTRFSDGLLSPPELVLAADRAGLDAVAVTEHNVLFPARMASWFSELVGGPIILEGQEITTRNYHLIAVGLTDRVVPSADLHEVIAEIHRQGGIAIAAHPTERYWAAFDPVRRELDGAEVVHPAAYAGSSSFSWDDMVTFFERSDAEPLTAIGSSDFHFFRTLGLCRTRVVAAEPSTAAILDALREGRTRTEAPDGRAFGDPGIGPSPGEARRPAYRAVDWLDSLTRALGWVGVVGLVVFRRRA
jgi:predicted metal-dependent phosphoesterase TrpH